MNMPIEWLLDGEPWVQYRTRVDLLGESESDSNVRTACRGMLADARVRALIDEVSEWPWTVISSHKSASQPFHKLAFLADLGLKGNDLKVGKLISKILKSRSEEGPFQLPVNIPEQYGGTGKQQWAWALCDAPLLVYALVKVGGKSEPAVREAVEYLIRLERENGWPCAVSKELGKFRGPGRKEDPCPFATLAMLKALAEADAWRDSPACRIGAEALLALWDQSSTQHPYMFFMGTDFRKAKVPFIWYDLVHVLDVLSKFAWLRKDPRLQSMLKTLRKKADKQGRFRLESVWTAWKDWEFGQKQEPSRWLTLSAWRIITRIEGISP